MLTSAAPGAHALSMVSRGARPPNAAPYPTEVGTAITGAETRPATTPGRAPSMPAATTTTRALRSSGTRGPRQEVRVLVVPRVGQHAQDGLGVRRGRTREQGGRRCRRDLRARCDRRGDGGELGGRLALAVDGLRVPAARDAVMVELDVVRERLGWLPGVRHGPPPRRSRSQCPSRRPAPA